MVIVIQCLQLSRCMGQSFKPEDCISTSMAVSPAQESGQSPGLSTRFKIVMAMMGVSFGALFLGDLLSIPLMRLAEQATGTTENLFFAAGMALSFVGMFAGGAAYLLYTSRGFEYVDLSRPTMDTVKYAVGGAAVAMVVMVGISTIVMVFDLPIAESWVTEEIGDDMQMAALFMLVVLFFNAPAEEFLFRNVIQKRLTEAFTQTSAIVLASGLFMVVHLPGYLLMASAVETVAPMMVIFLASLVFGALYAYTRELLVVIGAHALYNLLQVTLFVLGV